MSSERAWGTGSRIPAAKELGESEMDKIVRAVYCALDGREITFPDVLILRISQISPDIAPYLRDRPTMNAVLDKMYADGMLDPAAYELGVLKRGIDFVVVSEGDSLQEYSTANK